MTGRRMRDVCEHLYMLAVGFFLLWNVFYMTEAQWTFDVRGAFPAVWLGLAAAALAMGYMKPGVGGWLLALPVWMLIASAYRGMEVLQAQTGMIARAVLAFGVMLPAPRIIRRERFERYLSGILALWTACMTLQSLIGLWAALTGHAVFSLRGTWYIGVNLGDHRLYLNAYVTTGAVKLGLSVLLTALGMAKARKRSLKLVYGCCGLLQLACLSLTDCRTAFLAVGAALGLMPAALILRGSRERRWLRRALALCTVLALTAAAYIGLSGLLTVLSPHVPQTLDNITLTELPAHLLPEAAAEGAVQHRELQADNLFNDRQIIWRAAAELLRSEPKFLLTGTTMALSPVLTNQFAAFPAGSAERAFDHVHSIYLQVLVAWGVPGLLLLAVSVAAFLRAAWRVMLRHPLPLWQRMTPVPVLYVLLCETVDCFTRLSEDSPVLLFACLLAGFTLVTDVRANRAARTQRPLTAAVDVIVPVYNAADYVRRAVQSVLATPGARVILVDDGSTDGSGELCDTLAEDDRVRVVHQENRGASAARNAGLAVASADYVAFLDADDELIPGGLSALLDCLGDADAVQGVILRAVPESLPRIFVNCLSGCEALAKALLDPTRHLLCHGWLFRRSLLTERFDEALAMGEDGEWLLRTLQQARKAALTNIPAYCYTVRPDSAVHGGRNVQAAYLHTLTAADSALQALQMPQEAAMYCLTHLLLILTHDAAGQMAALRETEPFVSAFAAVRLTGCSPRMLTLRLLRHRAYALAGIAIRIRRWMNGRAMRQSRQPD